MIFNDLTEYIRLLVKETLNSLQEEENIVEFSGSGGGGNTVSSAMGGSSLGGNMTGTPP
jgi:hypothetical protein